MLEIFISSLFTNVAVFPVLNPILLSPAVILIFPSLFNGLAISEYIPKEFLPETFIVPVFSIPPVISFCTAIPPEFSPVILIVP